jgi:hypothetical protein
MRARARARGFAKASPELPNQISQALEGCNALERCNGTEGSGSCLGGTELLPVGEGRGGIEVKQLYRNLKAKFSLCFF